MVVQGRKNEKGGRAEMSSIGRRENAVLVVTDFLFASSSGREERSS